MENETSNTTETAAFGNTLLAAGISKERAEIIREKCYQIAMLLNDIECDLHAKDLPKEEREKIYELKYILFGRDSIKSPTIWGHFYELEKAFGNACR